MSHRRFGGSKRGGGLCGAVVGALMLAPFLGLPAAAQDSIPFSTDLEATLAEARESDKPVVLAFAAVWCPNCRQMEEVTLRDPLVLAFAERYHWVIIDIDRNITLANE